MVYYIKRNFRRYRFQKHEGVVNLDKIVVRGGRRLKGEVNISGAKNAAIAVIPAAILSDGVCRIENIPNISDVFTELETLTCMGATVTMRSANSFDIDTRGLRNVAPPYELARKMRASYYFLGALAGRFGEASVPMPGGCDIGVRPIDQHVKGFEALGARVDTTGGIINLKSDRLLGSSVYLDVVSVGATVNIMLAAVKARGLTVIENAAKEPHIVDLANFLNTMGADVRGAGTDTIKIRGTQELHGCNYALIPDQIEAGTYMAAAAGAGGEVLINNVIPKHLESISAKLEEMGAEIREYDEAVYVGRTGPLNKVNIKTMPHPGFPTDMHPQIAAVLSVANGTSIINESVWENRFKYVDELKRFGANIQVDGKIAVIEGVEKLKAAPVRATDLRAGAAMIIAGLMAEGTTEITHIHHIERGYENIIEKLQALGADIHLEKDYTETENVAG